MKKELKNIKASVHDRLLKIAKEIARPFDETLKYFGMERFLYRFGQSEYSDKFILKGALLFAVWKVPERRTTLDIDFLGRFDNQITLLEKAIKEICNFNVVDDGLVFDSKTVQGQRSKENADYEGVRIKFKGFLNRSLVPMQIDIGFGDIIFPKPQIIDYPVMLDFPKPHLKGYPIESVIAEKFEAMVKLGSLNSRMKDFYDLWLIIRQFDLDGKSVAEAIKRTFYHRKTKLPDKIPLFGEEIYDETSDRQTLWKAFLTKNQIKHAPEKLKNVATATEKFLIKLIDAIN